MRLGPPLLALLLPAVRVLAATTSTSSSSSSTSADADADANTAPLAAPRSAAPAALLDSPAQQALRGTKDAPVDGLDGKPHAGPYVDDQPTAGKKPNIVQDLGPKLPGPLPSPTFDGVLAGDKSVMQDPQRLPATGSTGTEGGVSAKDAARLAHEEQTGSKKENVPESPKEPPPHPHVADSQPADGVTERVLDASGLEKPSDLPRTPHDIPHPVPASLAAGTDPLGTTPSSPAGDGGVIQPLHSSLLAFTMILFSEIGDKTFLVAALMAMRHPRLVVFSAAFAALAVMTVLSAVLGHAVPALLSERITHFAAAALFLVFGARLLREGLAMHPEDGVGEEMREVEQELEEKEQLARRNQTASPYALEAGRTRRSRSNSRLPAPARSPSSSPDRIPSSRGDSFGTAMRGLNNLLSLLLSPAWVQTFVMTFLGEWGDRSQIATVAMAAGSDYWWVTAGAVAGHGLCTAGAVLGGRAVAGRISMRNITVGGAIAFLIFGVIYLLEAFYHA